MFLPAASTAATSRRTASSRPGGAYRQLPRSHPGRRGRCRLGVWRLCCHGCRQRVSIPARRPPPTPDWAPLAMFWPARRTWRAPLSGRSGTGCASSLEIERQVQPRDQYILKLPWSVADDPAHIGVLSHPGRQCPLAFNEGQTVARSDPPQLNPQLVSKEAAQRFPQRRALGVARVVVLDPFPEILLTWGPPVSRRPVRADPRIQQPQPLMQAAALGHDQSRRPGPETTSRRHRPWRELTRSSPDDGTVTSTV